MRNLILVGALLCAMATASEASASRFRLWHNRTPPAPTTGGQLDFSNTANSGLLAVL